MRVSESSPIKFWDYSEDTFNEGHPDCGLNAICFCQPWNCADSTPLQVYDSEFQEVELLFYDSENNLLNSQEFTEIAEGAFQVYFAPSELSPPLCEKISLIIQGIQNLKNEEFDTNLDDWSQSGAGNAWAWDAGGGDGSARSNTVGAVNSAYLSQSIAIKSNVNGGVELSLDVQLNTSVSAVGTVRFKIYGFLNDVPTEIGEALIPGAGVSTLSDIQLTLGNFDAIGFALVTEGGEYTVDVNYFRISYIQFVKKSDCIDMRNAHLCTKLISYTNADNFDGLIYEISPQPTFYKRIPANWVDSQNPQTLEDLELSNGVIVTVRQTIQEKQELEIGFLPWHEHKTIQKIFMHDTFVMDEIQWKRRDAYEAPKVKDYALKKATVLLTIYNSVLKNTI
jgi:hypothetical protein